MALLRKVRPHTSLSTLRASRVASASITYTATKLYLIACLSHLREPYADCTTYGSEAHRLERLLYQLDNRAANAEVRMRTAFTVYIIMRCSANKKINCLSQAEASRARDDCERMRQSAVQQAEGLQTQLSQKERDVNAYSQRARDEADERCRLRKALTDTELELQRMKNVQSNCYFENASGKYGEVSHLDERSSEVADHDDRYDDCMV